MPPKAAPKGAAKEKSKADLAKKQKVVEDKTFGLKNKNKSKNKSVVCEFFRHGQCAKGFKCKYSHDLSLERKGENNIYCDQRDEETMDEWDQETLEKAVAEEALEYNSSKPTEIVCKHFLDAVEKKQYGWFWTCPNGGKDCHYRHALPAGYVLKSQMKALLEEGEKLSNEEEIENQRHMTKTTTPMTGELFAEWKRKKAEAREAELTAIRAERARTDRMSGRELFLADTSLFVMTLTFGKMSPMKSRLQGLHRTLFLLKVLVPCGKCSWFKVVIMIFWKGWWSPTP